MAKIALLADIHAPYQDDKSIELACLLLERFKPDRVYNLGDGYDFYQFSIFSQDPRRKLKFQEDLDVGCKVQQRLISAAPEAQQYYIPGNHDERWPRHLALHQELHSLRSLDLSSILELDKLGIKLCPPQVSELDNRIILTHSRYISQMSAMTARINIDRLGQRQQSVFVGHSHRQGMFFVTGPRLSVVGVEIGCLCNPLEYTNGFPDWQRGVCFITTEGHLFDRELITFSGMGDEQRGTVWREKEYIIK